MKLKALSIAALALSLASGAAIAQQATQDGGSNATPENTQRGTPMLQQPDAGMTTNSTSGTADWSIFGPFFTDESMTTMRTDDEFSAAYQGLTEDEQTALKDGCTVTPGSTAVDVPESVLQACEKINAM